MRRVLRGDCTPEYRIQGLRPGFASTKDCAISVASRRFAVCIRELRQSRKSSTVQTRGTRYATSPSCTFLPCTTSESGTWPFSRNISINKAYPRPSLSLPRPSGRSAKCALRWTTRTMLSLSRARFDYAARRGWSSSATRLRAGREPSPRARRDTRRSTPTRSYSGETRVPRLKSGHWVRASSLCVVACWKAFNLPVRKHFQRYASFVG